MAARVPRQMTLPPTRKPRRAATKQQVIHALERKVMVQSITIEALRKELSEAKRRSGRT